MTQTLEFYAKTIVHVHYTSVFIPICLNVLLPSMCGTRLTLCIVSLLLDVA